MWRYQKATIMETTVFTPAQQRILQMMSYVKSDEEFADIEDLLSNYFAKKVDDELDALCEEGQITPADIEQWGNEHMRTPYK